LNVALCKKELPSFFTKMKKIQDQGILFPILLTFGEKKGMRLFFYPAPKKIGVR